MNTDERWNLDRKPTAIERGIGIGGALLLCAVGILSLWISVFVKSNLVASLVAGAFTALSMFFLVRFIFTRGHSLHRPAIIATAVVFIAVGLAMLAGSVFTDVLQERLFLIFFGVSGISGGMMNLSKAKKLTEKK